MTADHEFTHNVIAGLSFTKEGRTLVENLEAMRYFMPVFDARENDKYWITPNGFTCDSEDLAKRIRIDEFIENPNLNVTIHEFRDMRAQRTVFYL